MALSLLRNRHLQVLAGLIVAAAAIRFATLGLQTFDHEEAITAGGVLQPSLSKTISQTLLTERSGPPYYVVAWAWSLVFGTGEIGLRSLSALAGTLTVPAAYAFATTLVSRRTGLVTAALVAFNADLIWYSQEARSYALFILLSTVGLFCLARTLKAPTGRNFAWWAGTSCLAMAVHYFAGFLVAGQALWLLLGPARRKAVITVGAMIPIALVLVRLALLQQSDHTLGIAGHGGTVPVGDTIHVSLAGRLLESIAKFVTGEQLLLDAGLLGWLEVGALAVTIGALILSLATLIRAGDLFSRRGAVFSGSVALGAIVLPVLLAVAGFDLIKTRNLVGVIVPLIVVLASGLAVPALGRLGAAATALLCSAALSVTIAAIWTPAAHRPDWGGVARLIGRPSGLRLLVVTRTADDILPLYMRASGTRVLVTRKRQLAGASVGGAPASALPVTEIVVASDSRNDGGAPQGFRLTQRLTYRQFTIRRYRPVGPRRIDALVAYQKTVLPGPRSLLVDGVQPPRAS